MSQPELLPFMILATVASGPPGFHKRTASAPAPANDAGNDRKPGSTVVLVVDDDDAVRTTTGMILQDIGYSVVECGTGEAALDMLRRCPGIDLLLTDVVMPGMNGVELARLARAMRSSMPIVFFSGYTDLERLSGDVVLEPIIRKPFRARDLAAQIEASLSEDPGGAG